MTPHDPTAPVTNPALQTLLIGRQIAAARALLQITQPELAAACGITRYTLSHFELGALTRKTQGALTAKAMKYLEKRGIRLLYDGDEVGVMLNPLHAQGIFILQGGRVPTSR